MAKVEKESRLVATGEDKVNIALSLPYKLDL